MAAVSVQILTIGKAEPSTDRLISQLATRGHGAMHAETLAEARSLLQSFRFTVVLAQEALPDGRGYDLARTIARQGGNLFVGVALSEILWLPVVERGAIVFGQRALNASVFENEIEMALGAVRVELRREGSLRLETAGPSHRVAAPKRRRIEAA